MLGYIAQRLVQSVIVMLVVALIAFSLFQFVGDPINAMVGQDTTQADREQLRHSLGLDQPVPIQFLTWVGRAVRGEFGLSYQLARPVGGLILEKMPATYDAHNAMFTLMASRDPKIGRGDFNDGGFAYKEIDDLTGQVQSETDSTKRLGLISEALKFVKDHYLYIPLHQQVVVWAARDNVDVAQPADNYFPLRYVTVK